MAALYGQRFVAVHIPKTGGKWVRRALEAAGFPFHHDLSNGHDPAPAINNPDWVSFCFIRHPASWLASWYAYCERTAWLTTGRLPETFDRSNHFNRMYWETSAVDYGKGFERWVEQIEMYYPGYVAKFFEPYMKSVQIVGRQERLREDLERIVGPVPAIPAFNVGENVPDITPRIFDIVADNEPLEELGYAETKEDFLQERVACRAQA